MDKLFNSQDRTVEAHIVFVGLAILFVGVVALIVAVLKPEVFHINDLGASFGWIMGGGGAYAGGQAAQTRLSDGNP